jgi:WD40 repeat protein
LSQCDKSCNDKILISTLSTTARLFNLHDGRLLHTFPHEDASAHTAFLTEDGIATVKFVQDGNRILASRRVVVSLRDPKDGSVTKTLELPEDIDRTWLSGSGRYALARRGNGEAGGILWGIKSDKPVKLFPIDGIFSGAAFSSDGRKLVYCCGMSITVSSIQDYPGSIHYGVPGTFIASIAVSHDGSLILSGDRGKSKTPSSVKLMRKLGLEIRVQPRKTTPPIAALSCGKTGRILRTFPGHDLMIHTVAFTPDTKRAITASKDRIQIWDISDVRTETQQ